MEKSHPLISVYTERRNTFREKRKYIQQRERIVSWIRVGLALLIILILYLSFKIPFLGWVAAPLAVLYAVLVRMHEKFKEQNRLYQNLIRINEQELKSLQGDHSSFEGGNEFVDAHHTFTLDLDIFGDGSVFQRINRTCTEPGKERLAYLLANPLASADEIRKRQEAVEELSARIDFRQYFRAIGMGSKERKEDQQKILDWLTLPAIVYGKKSYRWMLITLPVVSLITLLYWIMTGTAAPFVVAALVQWTITGTHAKRITLFQDYIGNKRNLLEKFAAHFDLLNGENFTSSVTKQLNRFGHEARVQLQSLAGRARALDLRLNMLANILLNSTMLYDIRCVYHLEKWREQNRDHLEAWLKAIAETDALNSLATFCYNHPEFRFPEIAEDRKLVMEEAGHPLIKKESCVNNNVEMKAGSSVWIVTGANMAGKSTFLRTVGVNMVLALTGSVVCARRMVCPLAGIYTGMRNTDSINENQSYFFAELLRLQHIMEKLKEGRPLLILLDEILKGTNSADKLTGSMELVKQLVSQPCFVIVATHDIALGELATQYDTIRNFHFETFIRGDELSFDYKLKHGISTGKNATFLMRKMGIIQQEPPQ